MLSPHKIASSHAELFIERYERLRAWALQLTAYDQQLAEDLLHDAFIQFTLSRPDLQAIRDLDGYLFVVLRNLHLSQVRRSTRSPISPLSIVEYDSAEVGLRVIDPRAQMKVQDDLRTVCQYACLRKETSRAGSVLILRFFHGYYPDEIARVMRSSHQAVKDRLRIARAEAKLYLEDPARLNFMREVSAGPPEEITQVNVNQNPGDFLNDLRQVIFRSRRGDCLSGKQFRELYRVKESGGPTCHHLAHLVSCPQCLDEINALHGDQEKPGAGKRACRLILLVDDLLTFRFARRCGGKIEFVINEHVCRDAERPRVFEQHR